MRRLAGLAAAWLCGGLHAAEVLDRGSVELGFSTNALDGEFAVNGRGGVSGTEIDVDRDLDVGGRDRSRSYALRWRPFERHEFALRRQSYQRSGDRTITRDLVFDGQTFAVNSQVRGELDLKLWSFDYLWWPWVTERQALAVSVGALQYRLGVSLDARNLPGGIQPEPVRAEVSEDLPVLVLGTEYRQLLSERWRLLARAAVFKASVGRVEGTVYNIEAGVEYALSEHATLALRYLTTRLDANAERAGFDGTLGLDLAGVQTALMWRW